MNSDSYAIAIDHSHGRQQQNNSPSVSSSYWDEEVTRDGQTMPTRCRACVTTIAVVLIVALATTLLAVIIYEASKYNTISHDVRETRFQVDAISFSPISSSPSANWTIGISAVNLAPKSFASFRNVEVWVWYDAYDKKVRWTWNSHMLLATADVEDFGLAPLQHTNISDIHAAALLESPVARAIADDIRTRRREWDDGRLRFGVSIRFNAMYRDRDVTSYITSKARCGDLRFRPSPTQQNTFIADTPKHCRVGHVREEEYSG
ncbi:OLC1v1004754C1 [Oldenlandia corymbosa var. corymbosa]|uniref:OLC1v1004754C1 n=1 Tax=Oldenlandia corymbosa var. corymbosa TaxID=529605 RepID=A0AAV1DDS5_OLDCO|nr:OLC1v1004754C1 [Oldenlandia corymbosa var. corymbosa]